MACSSNSEVFLYQTSTESISLCSSDSERSFRILLERLFLINIETPPSLLFLPLSSGAIFETRIRQILTQTRRILRIRQIQRIRRIQWIRRIQFRLICY